MSFINAVVMLQRLKLGWLGDERSIAAMQDRKLRRLLRLAVKRSAFYRRRFADLDIEHCALTDLPVLDKAQMMDNYDDLVTDKQITREKLEAFIANPDNLGKYYLGKYGVSHTSGSQGQPALIVQDKDALLRNYAVQWARGNSERNQLLPHLDRLLNPALMAVVTQQPGFYPSGAAFSYLPEGAQRFFKLRRLSVFDPIEFTVAQLNDYKPNFITGYTSSLEIIAREEEAGRLHLRKLGCLKQIINVSEPLPVDTAAWISGVFGVPITNQYAMGECMALSSSCMDSVGVHINPDHAILEVVDAQNRPVKPGTTGARVLLTNLYNTVQPIIRYQIDDRVRMATARCSCGNLTPKIEEIEGRSKDKFWIEVDGKPRDMPYYVFLAALHHYLDMGEHQVIQTGLNTFLLRAAPRPGRQLSAKRVRELVLQSVRAEGLEHAMKFDVEIVSSIERGPSGKAIRTMNTYGPPPASSPSVDHHA